MHLLEQYALSSGLKIGKPFIYEVFFPIEPKKYITLQKEVKFPSRQYKYWQQVVDLVNPILFKNNVKIVQIGSKNDKALKGVVYTSGETSIAQVHYLIRNSQMHVGIDSFAVHIASGLGKKIVALYSNMTPENSGPYWSNPLDCILIQSPRGDRKPSYAADENPRTINEIKPETIANSVLKLLDIQERVSIETLFIGENFNEETNFGFLPNQIVVSEKIPELRMDLFPEEKHLPAQLSKQRTTITTSKPISQETLLKFKANVAKVIYLIDENDKPEFVKFLFENGFPFACVSKLKTSELKKKKINYYRYCTINEHSESESEKKFRPSLNVMATSDKVKFKTNYILCSDRNNYLSEQHLLDGDIVDDINGFYPLKRTDLFLRDIKNTWIIKELY